MKRDIEAAASGANGFNAGTTGTARVSASLESWMSTNWTTQSSPTSAASVGFVTGTGCTAPVDATSPATVTEANVKAIIRAAWTAGGKPDTILVGPYNKVKVSGFSGILTNNIFQQAGGQAKIVAAADAYVSDFGTLKVSSQPFQSRPHAVRSRHELLGDRVSASVPVDAACDSRATRSSARSSRSTPRFSERSGKRQGHGPAHVVIHLETLLCTVKNLSASTAHTVSLQVRGAGGQTVLWNVDLFVNATSTVANVGQSNLAFANPKLGTGLLVGFNTALGSVSYSVNIAGWIEDTNG
jgi:hypothetical protein